MESLKDLPGWAALSAIVAAFAGSTVWWLSAQFREARHSCNGELQKAMSQAELDIERAEGRLNRRIDDMKIAVDRLERRLDIMSGTRAAAGED